MLTQVRCRVPPGPLCSSVFARPGATGSRETGRETPEGEEDGRANVICIIETWVPRGWRWKDCFEGRARSRPRDSSALKKIK